MSKITESARNEECLVYAPGVMVHDKETVVLAHLNGYGKSIKDHDMFSAYACHLCHRWLDFEYAKTHTKSERNAIHNEAVIRTQRKLLQKGLIKIS